MVGFVTLSVAGWKSLSFDLKRVRKEKVTDSCFSVWPGKMPTSLFLHFYKMRLIHPYRVTLNATYCMY